MASFAVEAAEEKPNGVEMGEIEKSRANHLLQSSRNDQYWT